ncbi:Protein CBG20610 [Caenorhabditis briggsae]|nr:Protein CBG20610 [Caenorhabditis briggsae]CAP37589.1 Protein CBG20610 [Caenorhabditis briggsae]
MTIRKKKENNTMTTASWSYKNSFFAFNPSYGFQLTDKKNRRQNTSSTTITTSSGGGARSNSSGATVISDCSSSDVSHLEHFPDR